MKLFLKNLVGFLLLGIYFSACESAADEKTLKNELLEQFKVALASDWEFFDRINRQDGKDGLRRKCMLIHSKCQIFSYPGSQFGIPKQLNDLLDLIKKNDITITISSSNKLQQTIQGAIDNPTTENIEMAVASTRRAIDKAYFNAFLRYKCACQPDARKSFDQFVKLLKTTHNQRLQAKIEDHKRLFDLVTHLDIENLVIEILVEDFPFGYTGEFQLRPSQ